MKIITDQSLTDFKFWSGAETNAAELTYDQLKQAEAIIDDLYPDGMTDTQLNDLFWFDFEAVQEWLGITTEEDE